MKVFDRFEKVEKLKKILDNQSKEDKIIIFVNMKSVANELSVQLNDYPNVILHGDIDQRNRVRNL